MAWDGQQEDAPFNMAMMFYISLNKLIEQKQNAYMDSDVVTWYKSLRAIYIKISFKAQKEEKAKLEKLFSETKNKMRLGLKNEIVYRKVSDLLDKIDMELIDIMDKRKMIFPSIDLNKMDDVIKRYGLDDDKNRK